MHVEEYLATAALVQSCMPRELHGCHWPVRRGAEVSAFIGETRDYVQRVDELVRASLAQPLTLQALIAQINEQLDPPWPDEGAQELVYSIHGHAERLVELGLASRERGDDGIVVYEGLR
jgi:hypothetical protein